MAKLRSDCDVQGDAWYWRRERSNPPPGCLWRLCPSASTLTEPFRPDGNVFCWCLTHSVRDFVDPCNCVDPHSQVVSYLSPSYAPRAWCRRNARRDFCSVTHCNAIPMQVCTQWTHSDVWSQLPTTPQCLFKIGDRQSEKKRRHGDRRAICDATRGLDAGHGVIRHRGVSDGSDGARRLWRSHSAWTEMFFADGSQA